MSTIDQIAEQAKKLPPEKQREVLDFVQFLQGREKPRGSRRSLYGILEGKIPDITEEDIAEARREMWGNFPREDI